MMQIRVGRILIAAVAAEVLAVLVLVLLVVLFGPAAEATAQAYAERLGYWVGPIAGFGFCLLGGFWVARGLHSAQVVNGFLLGVVVAAIDIAILVVSGAAFQPIFALSNLGRVIAGSIGGWLARHFARTPLPETES